MCGSQTTGPARAHLPINAYLVSLLLHMFVSLCVYVCVLCVQISMVHVLQRLGKLEEALITAKGAYQESLVALGPRAYEPNLPLSCYWRLLHEMVRDTLACQCTANQCNSN